MRIESGPTTERQVRNGLMFLLVAVFAGWFAWDGWRGYANKNLQEMLRNLSPEQRAANPRPAVHAQVGTEDAEAVSRAAARRDPGEVRAALKTLFGGDPSVETADAWFYFGPAAGYKLPLIAGTPTGEVFPLKTPHTATDISMQRGLAVALMLLAVYLAIHLLRVRFTHGVIDDDGLRVRGRKPISWAAMRRLDTSRFKDKGWVDLHYKDADGNERCLRLDEYHYAQYDAMLTAICERKGFPNPLVRSTESTTADAANEPDESTA